MAYASTKKYYAMCLISYMSNVRNVKYGITNIPRFKDPAAFSHLQPFLVVSHTRLEHIMQLIGALPARRQVRSIS